MPGKIPDQSYSHPDYFDQVAEEERRVRREKERYWNSLDSNNRNKRELIVEEMSLKQKSEKVAEIHQEWKKNIDSYVNASPKIYQEERFKKCITKLRETVRGTFTILCEHLEHCII